MDGTEWKGGTLVILLLILSLISIQCDDSPNECNTQSCWELYQRATMYYQSDVPAISNAESRRCTVNRTYKKCLNEFATLPGCQTYLGFRSSMSSINTQMRELNCNEDGPVYPEGAEPIREEPATPCRFKGQSIYNFCSLFGDPHLVTFGGEQLTCKLEGAWPLIDNQFLTVQVTNALFDASTKSATVTKKVTVVVKGMGSDTQSGQFCGSRHAVFYHAEVGSLPSTFTDGLKEYGVYKSVQVNTVIPGQQVELYLRYIDSTVVIRQVDNRYLSVGIRMPEEVINGTLKNPEQAVLRQLCFNSCPSSERIDIGSYLTNLAHGSGEQQTVYELAQQTCRDVGVTDYFFDSCVFDVLMTGEPQLAGMASSAYSDVKRYSSRQPRWTNRTDLDQYTKKSHLTKDTSTNGDGSGGLYASSAYTTSANLCLVRTLLFVYISLILTRYVIT